MFVRAEYRGRQIGSRLVHHFLAWCKARGAPGVSVTAYAATERAIAFNRSFGFTPRTLTLERGLDT
jgi:GNAT superfamily N-acetyltransferase